MKILITGAFGYIGNEILKILTTKNNIFILANDNSKDAFEKFYPIWKEKIEYINEDICDLKCPSDVDFVIHLAAEVGWIKCSKDENKAIRTNILGSKNIASFSKPTLFFSTDCVYGDVQGVYEESVMCNPKTLYAQTKLEAERIFKSVPHCIIRPATAYGIGEYNNRDDLLVHNLSKLAAKEGEISLFQPNTVRSICHISTIVQFVQFCIENWSSCKGQILNIGTEAEVLTKKEIVKKISKHCDCKIRNISGEDPDCRNNKTDYSRIISLCGRKKINVDSKIEQIVQYYLKGENESYCNNNNKSSF